MDDQAVDVDERAGALPRHRADEPLALECAEELLARAAQAPRRLLEHRQRARAEQVGLDAVGRALELDDGLGGARGAEVERPDLELTAGPARRGPPAAPRRRAPRPRPRRASARSSAPSADAARLREVGGAALEQHHVARHQHALGGQRGGVVGLADVQRVGGDARRRRRRRACSAARSARCGRGRAARAARTCGRSAARASTRARRGTPRPACRRARPRRGRRAPCAGRRRGCRAPRRSPSSGASATIASCSSRAPGGTSASRNASQIASSCTGSSATAGCGPGRLEPRVGPRQRGGQALGVGGGAQAGDERVAVAVVGGAGDALGDDARRAALACSPALRRARAGGPRGGGGPALGLRARASRSGSSRSGGCGGRRAAREVSLNVAARRSRATAARA